MRQIMCLGIMLFGFLFLGLFAGNTQFIAPQMSRVEPMRARIPYANRIFAGQTAFFPTQAGKPLSPEQIFSILNPRSYINGLNRLQDTMIKDKWINEKERTPLDSQEHVIAFLIKSLDYLQEQKTISPKDYARFKQTLPGYYARLKQQEEKELRIAFEKSVKNKSSAYRSPLQISFISPALESTNKIGILNSLSMGFNIMFGIQSASAVSDCFKPGGIPLVPGPNLWAPCCNCSAGGYPIGCLNLMCAYWPAAIYDYTTGICGCG